MQLPHVDPCFLHRLPRSSCLIVFIARLTFTPGECDVPRPWIAQSFRALNKQYLNSFFWREGRSARKKTLLANKSTCALTNNTEDDRN